MHVPLTLLLAALALPSFAWAQEPVAPAYKQTHMLAPSADTPAAPYLAFPALLDLGPEILVSFKCGNAHAADPGAALDLLRLDPVTGKTVSRGKMAWVEGQIMQMGEWARFANGDVANYIDAQQKAVPRRVGLRVVRSRDGGLTFGSVERVGAVDGVEYGYAFEAITRNQTTWMLVMTFANLTGGKQIWKTSSQPGSVDVIRTDDNGRSWRFVRSITHELGGAAINESSFAADGEGFIIAARGYDKRQWLLRTDSEFKIKVKTDLAAAHPFIKSVIGRPRVFTRDGGWYLLARNFTGQGANHMRLSLFKFDPLTLIVTKHLLLDNAEDSPVSDGYYAAPYWRERDGQKFFNVITYKSLADGNPDIVRLEFKWEEVK